MKNILLKISVLFLVLFLAISVSLEKNEVRADEYLPEDYTPIWNSTDFIDGWRIYTSPTNFDVNDDKFYFFIPEDIIDDVDSVSLLLLDSGYATEFDVFFVQSDCDNIYYYNWSVLPDVFILDITYFVITVKSGDSAITTANAETYVDDDSCVIIVTAEIQNRLNIYNPDYDAVYDEGFDDGFDLGESEGQEIYEDLLTAVTDITDTDTDGYCDESFSAGYDDGETDGYADGVAEVIPVPDEEIYDLGYAVGYNKGVLDNLLGQSVRVTFTSMATEMQGILNVGFGDLWTIGLMASIPISLVMFKWVLKLLGKG
jgi:hypothetical protein